MWVISKSRMSRSKIVVDLSAHLRAPNVHRQTIASARTNSGGRFVAAVDVPHGENGPCHRPD